MGKKVPVDIVKVDEPWAAAYLPDGSKIMVKLVFTAAYREHDDNDRPAFAPDGMPAYGVKFNWVINVEAPEKIQQKIK